MNMPENAPSPLASQLKLDAHWMPYTANRNFQRDPRLIVGAEGSWLFDDKGRKIYDSLSGLWTCGAGHTRKEIQEAVAKQLGTLDYSPGFQYGHPLSFQLAEKITDLTPGNLNHVFFTDSGSECADTAVKMVRAYWRLKGQATKTKMIGRARGYHGVNIAGTQPRRRQWQPQAVRSGDDGRRSPAPHLAGQQRVLPWHAGAGRYRPGR
ncbi:adenosylmethionine-8-amino-7-oxononanoate aminotransferase [Pseudomonas monsensis]